MCLENLGVLKVKGESPELQDLIKKLQEQQSSIPTPFQARQILTKIEWDSLKYTKKGELDMRIGVNKEIKKL